MSGVQPFHFEPTYPPTEDPTKSESEEESEGEAESSNFNARVGNTEWCICGGNCAAMSTADERFCRQEVDALNKKFNKSMIECFTNHTKFRIVCFETDALLTAVVTINIARCNPLPDLMENRIWRLAAYRQFTWWVHGYLGRKNRRVITACVVKAIQMEFPEESSEYAGFKPAEIDFS